MLILSLFILQALSPFYCYDPELDGVMKVGKNLFDKINHSTGLSNKVLPLNLESTKIVDSEVTQIIKEARMARNKMPDDIKELMNHLRKKAKDTLQNFGKQILTDLNIKKNITSMLEIVTEDFAMMIQHYYDFVNADLDNSLIDRDFVYLDLVETSSRLLYSEGRALLEEIIMDQNLTSQNKSVQLLNQKIFKQSIDEKKQDMKYVCDSYDICREYPAFTDYCSDLISEILKLSDDKFRQLLDLLVGILKRNNVFIATVSEKEDRELMIAELQPLSTDILAMKEFFVALREVITQKFKSDLSGDEELRVKSKAMRILLDIIDKTLSTDNDLLAIDFENSLATVRSWGIGDRKEINGTCKAFANKLFKILEYNLTNNARKEIRVLIKTIVRGTPLASDDEKLVLNLLMHGSKYVQGEGLPLDVAILDV